MSEVIKLHEPKFENSSWNFEVDQTNFYAFWNNAFSKEECQSIINIAKDKTELIEDKDIKYNIGDKCRIKTDTKLFDKMKRKYSAEICTIIKVKKKYC